MGMVAILYDGAEPFTLLTEGLMWNLVKIALTSGLREDQNPWQFPDISLTQIQISLTVLEPKILWI